MVHDEALVQKVARALFDAENVWRDMQQGLQGERLPERHFKVAIGEYLMKANAVLDAINAPAALPIDTEKEVYSRTEMWRSGVEGQQEGQQKAMKELASVNAALRADVERLSKEVVRFSTIVAREIDLD